LINRGVFEEPPAFEGYPLSGAERTHPSLERLADFSLGKLEVGEAAEIAAHVANCKTCQEVVDNQPDDALVALVREAIEGHRAQRNGERPYRQSFRERREPGGCLKKSQPRDLILDILQCLADNGLTPVIG
jgi:hypothetical protein